ncbi:MAG: polysaccharide deacetylase family protein, partial [Oscillospiraceae bacterium]
AEYDVYQTTRVNQPSIDGNTTFEQYWSVRRTKRDSGVISVTEHFKEWEKLGMEMGNLYEVALNVEGYQSSGEANVYKNNIAINEELPPSEPVTPVEPDDNGYYFHHTFESGADGWQPRGDASVSASTNASVSGNGSIYVTNRADNWQGASYNLSSNIFIPGNTYSLSACVMQDTKSSDDFQLTLQYTDASGEDNYVEIASASGEKGEWVKLENTSFTIPEGASNMLMYVEMPDSLSDFYVDEAIGAKEGVKNPVSISSSGKKGDVNLSGTVDIKDILDLKKYILGMTSDADSSAADISGDGTVNVLDLVMLKHIILTASNEPEQPETPETPENPETPVNPADTVNKSEPTQYGIWENNADISWIDTSKPMVAICFDDGPVGNASTDSSTRILNALEENGFHSTFFYWGNRINDNNKAEIKRAFDMGCEVANHTYTHPDLSNLSADEIRNEVNTTINLLNGITGGKNFLIRPPYLAVNDNVKANCYAPLITCSVDSQDWNNATAQQMIDKIVSKMNDGTLRNQVVLMHETYSTTAEAMEYLAPYMKEQGWQIVNVSEMFKANGKDMYSGTVYASCN